MKANTLTARITLFITFAVMFAAAIWLVSLIIYQQIHETRDLEKRAEVYAEQTAPLIYSDYIAFYTHPTPADFDAFTASVKNRISSNEEISAVSLIAINGRILFSSDEFSDGKYTGPPRFVQDMALILSVKSADISFRHVTEKGESFIEVVTPIKEVSGGHIVSMRYLVSYNAVNKELGVVSFMFLVILVVIVVLIVFVAVPFSAGLTKPLTQTTKSLDEISKGNLNVQLEKSNVYEIQALIDSLNRVLASLKLAVMKIGISKNELNLGSLVKEKENIESQLHTSEEFVNSIIEDAGVPVIAFDKDGALRMANTAFTDMTGYGGDDIDSRTTFMKKLLPEQEPREKFKKTIASFYAENKVKDIVIPLLCKNNKTVIVVSNITPIKDVNGVVIGEAIFMRDMSEIFELEQEIRHWVANGFVQLPRRKSQEEHSSDIEISDTANKKERHKKEGNQTRKR